MRFHDPRRNRTPHVLSLILGLTLAVPAATAQPTTETNPTPSPRRVIRCTVPTPKDWQQDSVLAAYKTACELSGWICLPDPVEWWHAAGRDKHESKVYQAQRWQNIIVREQNARVFIQIDPYGSPRRGPLSDKLPPQLAGGTFATSAVREAFTTEAVARVQWFDAEYVCLAMEIDAYYEEQPADFDHFVSLFAATREAIKRIRPDTIVLVSFQYEQLLGLFARATGQSGHEPRWNLIEKFQPHADAVGISSYPQLAGFKDPASLPDDYYARISRHVNKPIVFTELGWTTDSKYGGSAANQAEFLRRFERLTRGLDLLLVNYFVLHDTNIFGEFFAHMGLLDGEGRPREVMTVWKNLWPDR